MVVASLVLKQQSKGQGAYVQFACTSSGQRVQAEELGSALICHKAFSGGTSWDHFLSLQVKEPADGGELESSEQAAALSANTALVGLDVAKIL